MANASIGGLVSGLDTATIISQLMQLEARPQTNLKARVTTEQRSVNALQTLNSKLASIATKAADLAKLSNWEPMKATSTNDKVSVSAASTATLTSLDFTVTGTATTSKAIFNQTGTTDAVVGPVATDITVTRGDGTSSTFNTGTGSLSDIAASINDPANATGLQATLVKSGGTADAPVYQLHIVSKTTGAASDFSFGDFLGGVVTPAAGSTAYAAAAGSITIPAPPAATLTIVFSDGASAGIDYSNATDLADVATKINAANAGVTAELVGPAGSERLHLTSDDDRAFTLTATGTEQNPFVATRTSGGADASIEINGQKLTSSTNTFDELMPGVDVTLAAGATGDATISIARDTASLSDKVKSMVEVVNLALTELSSLTASSSDPKAVGLLAGDATLRSVRNQLIESVTGGVGGVSLAPYGVQTDRSGKLVFDEAKFKEAYAADPAGTAAKFAAPEDPAAPGAVAGFAANLESLAKTFSDSVTGTVTTSIKSRQSTIKGWENDIADWDVRLATRQTALQRQYTAMESALGQLQSQGNWLAGQLAGLPSWNSGQ